ncbi:MAG: hypothetical protein GF384_02590 [Elusimicrobia bacterium]|nr:hypothetical protein [Elusimicrobiota bacterium]MBD3411845.1 hypothetical protein [Elusimicrobiota bacterium]
MIRYFLQGDFMMWPLLLCSIISLAVIIDRFFYFYRLDSMHKKINKPLRRAFDKRDLEELYKICRQNPSPLSHILIAGITKVKAGRDIVNSAMDESAIDQMPAIENRLVVLSTIASISTLLGFTGTVIGMIKAFQSIAREGISSPTIVAQGISAALITTASGLIIAIPTIVFYHYFSHRANREALVIEKYSKELLGLFEH